MILFMKRLAFLFSFFLLVSSSQASHLKGGYINYKCVSGRSYQITLVTFSDPNSPADINTSNAFIFFGDGDSLTIQRTQRVAVSVNLVENIYITTHTYVSDGNFLINFTDFSFVDGIVNVNGGDSKNQQFYIESFLKINSTIGAFNSPEPHSILPDLRAIGGKELYYNSTWFGRFPKETVRRCSGISVRSRAAPPSVWSVPGQRWLCVANRGKKFCRTGLWRG